MYELRKSTPLAVALALVLALLFGVLAMSWSKPASAEQVPPELVPGDVNCPAGYQELRIEPVADGTYTNGTLTVTIDVRDTAEGQVFDWTSNLGVDIVIAMGGPDTNRYTYDPPTEIKADTGLHAPVDPSNNQFYGLRHISFCYDITPSIKVEKSGDELSKVGDTVTYDFTITNDGDIPLNLNEVSDTLLGDLADEAPATCDTLAPGASCTFSATRTVLASDPDPLGNTVTVRYTGTLPSGSTTVSDTDTHETNLFQPSVTKAECKNGGYEEFGFKNQGACIKAVNPPS
jgi:uncharacterized repeat protein (TIGR01451 family)